MNELALFAGAGGGLLATTHLLGWRTVAAVEKDPYRREVLLRRQRDGMLDLFPIWDDIRTFDGEQFLGYIITFKLCLSLCINFCNSLSRCIDNDLFRKLFHFNTLNIITQFHHIVDYLIPVEKLCPGNSPKNFLFITQILLCPCRFLLCSFEVIVESTPMVVKGIE